MPPKEIEGNKGSAATRLGLTDEALERELEYLEVDQSMAGARGVIGPYCLMTVVLFLLMVPYSPVWSCVLWAGSFLIYIGARWRINRRYASLSVAERKARLRRLHRGITFSSGLFGAIVGSALVIAFPGSPVEIQFLWTTIMFMVVVAAPRLVTQRQFVALLIPPLVLTCGAWLMWGDRLGPPMATALFTLSVPFLGLMQIFHFGLREKFELQLRNEHLAAELASRNATLEQMAQDRARQLAAASHDLRQPVHALGLLMDQVRREPKPESLVHRLSLVSDCVDSLSEMLTNLMDLTLMDSERFLVCPCTVPLQEILDEAQHVFAAVAGRKKLDLFVVQTRLLVWSDPQVLRRMLFNLLSNAIKYSHQGTIEVRAELVAGLVVLHVQDEGIGISREQQALIFEDYVTSATPSPNGHEKSVGLGLGIVRRCAAMLGHEVKVQSAPAQGSCFSIHLGAPVSPDDVNHAFTPPGVGLQGVVAIVEKDPNICGALTAMLSEWGCTPVAGPSADHVKAKLDRLTLKPHLILADMHPDVCTTGFDAIASLRTSTQVDPLPALILTGDLSRAHQQHAESRDIRLVHKPLQPARLRAVLGEMLNAV